MESFIISFPKGSLLYRATNEENPSNGLWYTLHPADTYGYGKYTNEFITKATHPLIDITSTYFYNNFMNKLNELSLTNNYINERKLDILFPLGFIDTNVYKIYATQLGITIKDTIPYDTIQEDSVASEDTVQKEKQNIEVQFTSQLFNNRYRHSNKTLDEQFMFILKFLYPNVDGFISKYRLPDILQNGFQHPEVCFFKLENIEFNQKIERPAFIGGSYNTDAYYKTSPYLEKFALDTEQFLKENAKQSSNQTKTSENSNTSRPTFTKDSSKMDAYYKTSPYLEKLKLDMQQFLKDNAKQILNDNTKQTTKQRNKTRKNKE